MATKKLTDLTALTSPDLPDVFLVVDVSENSSKSITWNALSAAMVALLPPASEYSGGSYTINWALGKEQYLALNGGASAITFINQTSGAHYTLILKQPLSGVAGTLTFPSTATLIWASGVVPTLTTANSGIDALFLVYSGVLGKYLGSLVNDFK